MIRNINHILPAHMQTIAGLADRPEEFILTGSRLFAGDKVSPATDYDFFVLAHEGTVEALHGLGFWLNKTNGYREMLKTGATVYTRPHEYPMSDLFFLVDVDVQVYEDPELFDAKARAQFSILSYEPDFSKKSKSVRSELWRKYITRALMGEEGPL